LLWILPVTVIINIVIAFIFTDAENFVKLKNFSIPFLILAAVCRFIPWITKSLRLYNWVRYREHDVSFLECVRIIIYTELGAMVSPTMIGGESFYAGMLYNKGVSGGEAVSLTSIAAVENTIFYLLGVPLALLLAPDISGSIASFFSDMNYSNPLIFFGIAIAVFIVGYIIIKNSKYSAKIKSKWHTFWRDFKKLYSSMIKTGKLHFLENVFLCFIHWGARYAVVTVLALGLGYELNYFKTFVLQWLVFFAMHFVPTPGASGGAEGLFLLLFNRSISGDVIGTILIGWRFIDFYFLGILAVIYLGFEKYVRHINLNKITEKEKKRAQQSEDHEAVKD